VSEVERPTSNLQRTTEISNPLNSTQNALHFEMCWASAHLWLVLAPEKRMSNHTEKPQWSDSGSEKGNKVFYYALENIPFVCHGIRC
jgi:hypothetical protein